MEARVIRLLGDRVLVALPPKATEQESSTGFTYQAASVSPSGIILAKPVEAYDLEAATRGIVVQVGSKRRTVNLDAVLSLAQRHERGELLRALERMAPAPFEVAVGQCVLFPPGVGEQIDQDGISYVILHEDQILARVESLQEHAA